MERGLLTGITRVSKESIFSDLNNLEVVTTTSEKYSSSFGFTEEEVFQKNRKPLFCYILLLFCCELHKIELFYVNLHRYFFTKHQPLILLKQ